VTLWGEPEAAFGLDRAKDLLVDRDYQEAITYTFISPEMAELLTPGEPQITLANPISADMAVMRASLWPGLLATMRHNLARQQTRVRVFESGLNFRRIDGELVQRPKLAAAITGNLQDEQWGQASRKADFFDLKGDLQALLSLVAPAGSFDFEAVEHPVLHPGQSARVLRDGQPIGWIGMLHPVPQKALDLPATFVFEIDLDGLDHGRLPAFTPISKYPAIRRDLAVVVGRDVPAGDVLACARAAAPANVREVALFDVYTGDNIEAELKSLALSLILQESSHTLTDQEVDQATTRVLDALASELSAKLRE
jgi:phenylalanyl-tRNA synthetase beta chain